VTRADGTKSTLLTNSSGLVTFAGVPIGSFDASYSYLGVSGNISNDVSGPSAFTGTMALSYPLLSVVAVVGGALAIFEVRRLRGRRLAPEVDSRF
jgi:hypothetical protein